MTKVGFTTWTAAGIKHSDTHTLADIEKPDSVYSTVMLALTTHEDGSQSFMCKVA